MRSKRIQQLGSAVVLTSMLSLTAAMPALADSSISTTGPNSTNTVKNTQTTTVNETNNNNITVTNSNHQTASTGSASVKGNTTAGSAMSGDATNSNNVSTTIDVGNSSALPGSGSGSVSSTGSGSGAGAGSGSAASSTPGKGGAGATAGSGSGSVAMLPATGCEVVCDVAALRAAYHPSGLTTAIQDANKSSALLMGLAALLSLVAAGGSAFYATKKQARA